MGKVVLTWRLAARSMRRRPADAVLAVLAITAAVTTLTMGLALYGVTSHPYDATRAATSGPDVVAMPNIVPPGPTPVHMRLPNGVTAADMTALTALTRARGVTGHAGPYPVSFPVLRVNGSRVLAVAEGRDQARAPIDQPYVTQGSWVRRGGVVLERGLAAELGATVGGRVTLNGRPFRVAGLAVTAAEPAYPHTVDSIAFDPGVPGVWDEGSGLVWLIRSDARALATPAEPVTYLLDLRLGRPGSALAFDNARSDHGRLDLFSWLDVRATDGQALLHLQRGLLIMSWLLGLLAIAGLAVLVGGRMTEQTRRTGLIKAVGGSPKLVASVVLAEYLGLALIAAAAGLGAGWLAAPFVTGPGASLVGSAGAPSVTWATAGWVALLALAVALAAALVPSTRAARTSTTSALGDAAHRPRRRALLVSAATRLPVPLLVGLRLAARRPRRMILTAVSLAITVMTVVAMLTVHAHLALHADSVNTGAGGVYTIPRNPNTATVDQVLLVVTVMLVLLAAVNTLVITRATAVDSRQPLAVARALGTSPGHAAAALTSALLLPALPGAIAGVPLGVLLVRAVSHGEQVTAPPTWWLAAAFAVTLLAAAGLSAVTARLSARQPVTGTLQSELA